MRERICLCRSLRGVMSQKAASRRSAVGLFRGSTQAAPEAIAFVTSASLGIGDNELGASVFGFLLLGWLKQVPNVRVLGQVARDLRYGNGLVQV